MIPHQIRVYSWTERKAAIRQRTGAEANIEFEKIKMSLNFGHVKPRVINAGCTGKAFHQMRRAIGDVFKTHASPT